MDKLGAVLERLEAGFEQSVERWKDLLRIPSISTDPAYAAETRRAGQWVVDDLKALGFEAALRDTAGHPMVVAHHPGPAGADVPHVMFYGHYDVQPPDPLELWETGPFEPTIVEGPHGPRMVARGAVDDKGQMLTWIEALRAWHAETGTLPVRVTVLVEGEEETGSPSFLPFCEANRAELHADVCVLSDTGSWGIDTPAITTMLRGLLYVEATLHGPNRDLHSGLYGGMVVNPINALARIVGELHDETGRVAIPGFYDDVRMATPEEAKALGTLQFDEKEFLGEIGLENAGGEANLPPLQRMWLRPTCDVNGMWGGYTGAGSKTVIAAHASAKISCRLVPGQDPQKMLAALSAFLEARTPAGFRWELTCHGASGAIRVPTDSPFLRAATAGLGKVYGRDAVLIGSGGSVPAVGWIKDALGVDSLLVGFGLTDDKVHSPNEKFELRCFRNGMHAHATILAELAKVGRRKAA